MHDLPRGTVTFLFTDVEGSTRLLQEHGAAYADLLAEHRRILREALAQHDGVEVDTQGDALFVAFSRAEDAVAAATEAQGALSSGPLRVRMGIHTGEPIVTEEGYVGMDVHRAARIAAAGHGGQVIVSASTAALLAPDSSAALRDLGEHRLKDLLAPERLYQLGEGVFAPLRTLAATNLPLAASELIGRERDLEGVLALLDGGARLVTVTGPGGTGKTRFALQVAAELVGSVADGVFWVPLAALSDPDLVPSEIGQALGARDDLTGFLRGKELVLLLDNFEHLVAAAPLVHSLLGAAPGLRVLVTSRAPLRVSGEREYALDPLSPTAATTLFVERARAVGRELVPDATVEAICRRLDGLPLAIELAAARSKLLTPETLLGRLDAALPLLTGGARDSPERQRTLRATIEWSYDLLEEPGRSLFADLAVFAGSFPLSLAEEVCAADLDALAALVDSSLLKPVGDDRFLMLETIREYALERLEESSRGADVRDRHAAAFAVLAERAYSRRLVAEAEASAALEADHDDLRAALEWLGRRDPEAELAVAGALGWFWLSHSHIAEGASRLDGALSHAEMQGAAHARALTAYGQLVAWLGAVTEGRRRLEEALDGWQAVGDEAELASALDALGWILVYTAGDNDGSLDAFTRSLALRRGLGDRAGETRSLVGVCQVLVAQGEVERAEELSRELSELARSGGDLRSEHFAYHFLADCSLIRGDFEEAETRYGESLEAALSLGDVLETSFEVQGLAMSAAGVGDDERAVRLAAAVEALWESLGTSFSVGFWDELMALYVGSARTRLGDEAGAIWTEGRELSFDAAVSLALGSSSR